ncbi:MAG TPA: hypothetical protein VFS21_22005 [Roseiflexaceae bacterium]|nr:hypothetical protein [Roseiflexaceae bacterium]
MRVLLRLVLLLTLLLVGCGQGSGSASGTDASAVVRAPGKPGAPTVDIVYLNHPPMRAVMSDINPILDTYGQDISVTKYQFGTAEGDSFAREKGVTGHTPIAIFVNGSMEATLGDQQVKFYNFPGISWNLDDFKAVLNQATGRSS